MTVKQVLAGWALDGPDRARADILSMRRTPNGVTFLDLCLKHAHVNLLSDRTILTILTCTAAIAPQLGYRYDFYVRSVAKVQDPSLLRGLACEEAI